MNKKPKGRTGEYQKTPKTSNANYFHSIASWTQTWIVTLAVWGWFPYRLAKWILSWGGRHEN
jgi:hypothetical protein